MPGFRLTKGGRAELQKAVGYRVEGAIQQTITKGWILTGRIAAALADDDDDSS
jgi:hypothetical protein